MKKNMTRREMIRYLVLAGGATLVSCSPRMQNVNATTMPENTDQSDPTQVSPTDAPQATSTSEPASIGNSATVFMTTDISAAGILKAYHALNRPVHGNVALKLHSGEPGGHNFLTNEFITPLVNESNATIVECNVAYGGPRSTTDSHFQVMQDHGFTEIAPVDIMDSEGTMSIPINGGIHLTEDIVGSHFSNYDFFINLAHFKGHMMGGFGGVIKNMSIGIAASMGKSLIHSGGKETTGFGMGTPQDTFLESMAEAAKGVSDYLGENIVYIDVMRKLSVDCDCMGNPAEPTMEDIGVLASLDPVALDQACVDLVYAAPDGKDLIERMESRHAIHTLEHAEAIGFGTRAYELFLID